MAADLFSTPEHALFRATVRKFVDEELRPRAREFDAAGRFDKSLYKKMGDLGMLGLRYDPQWGGAGLCDGCPQPLDKYREHGPYHNWALTDPHDVDVSFMADLLNGSFSISSEAGKLINSPVQHLNITQPPIQAPGSAWQVRDITGHAATTDMSTEIFYILTQKDGVTLP